ncbi:MAG TPA: hypothetical protein VG388_04905 [Solirubrobacteraceae bacterium]|nr:hypothetical protein [Solirubrobacteraceae bacterium]
MCARGQTRVLAPLLLAAGLALSSCGAGTARTPTLPAPGRSSTLARRTGLPAARRVRTVGAAVPVRVSGTTLIVTVKRVIDPLEGSGAKVPAGTTPVGVLISARNAGPANYDSSYTSDFELVTAAGPATPVFAPAGVCQTYVQDFMNALGAGVERTGCIAYAIPRGRAPTLVRFSPYGGHAGHPVSWVVAR